MKRTKKTKYAIVFNKVQYSSQKAIVNKSSNIKVGIENMISQYDNVKIMETILPQKACIEKSLENLDLDAETKLLAYDLRNEIEKILED